ncbi:hypothetical protein NJB1907f44_06650 [Mycobacterium marinum]|uniref:PE domain-containing protein n=1 Tax=Mycobacterium marinum TaxID=1781 RepID=UPI00235113F2|nr:PE domain-containing protein [Mycobacterium marinum]GJO08381.1 hypothetical protein NJB1907f34b_36360 [Mycobacterium marinum]GJO19406.1 hypothetical protein NJB1907E90_49810 [Mycobacterium marinum]GJO27734.1 hypothetical protein NJB1728e18_38670 [Mycobacterium marinum]GJO30023.1 hypothetical protein NJB1907E11_50890 [Mycobacterium marinum]GJO30468.1 hypothetical protein NJB1907f22_27210 [Mycobacterium marinum]
MSYVVAQPPAIAAAATELAGIGSALSEATAAAAGPTTAILSAAADEVSTAIAQLLGTFGAEYQGISTQLAAFHAQIAQRLATVANYYINAEEINNAALLEEATAGLYSPNSPPTVPAVFNDYVAIAMGGTGTPIPSTSYLDAVNTLYIQHIAPGAIAKALFTPEQLYPITGVKSLPFQTSVQEGLKILDISIWNEINAGNHVTVFGYSQSAVIASLEMQHFISLGPNARAPALLISRLVSWGIEG